MLCSRLLDLLDISILRISPNYSLFSIISGNGTSLFPCVSLGPRKTDTKINRDLRYSLGEML